MIDLKQKLTRREVRVFGLVLFPLFCALIAWRFRATSAVSYTAIGIGVAEAVAGLIDERVWRAVYRVLLVAVFPIAFVVSNVLIAVLWLLVFTVIGLIARLFGFDPMKRKFTSDSTYFIAKKNEPGTDRYFNQS